MNLKEAQLLGILALIAVGIILLCMWGGGDDVHDATVASDGIEAEGDLPFEPSISEICDFVRSEGSQPPVTFEPVREEFTVEIGGPRDPVMTSRDEEDAIRDMLKDTLPEEISVTPERESPPGEAPPPPARAPKPTIYVVKKGDTLSSISKEHYKTESKWRVIHEANRSVIPNPNVLPVGVKLTIPPADSRGTTRVAGTASSRLALSAAAAASRQGRGTYTAKKGDTLYRIAQRHYGDGSKWKDILAANRHLIQKDRDLKEGMTLVIP